MPTDASQTGLRTALGPAVLFIAAMAFGWPLAYIAAVLSVLVLKAPTAPSVKAGVALVIAAAGLMLAALAVSSVLLPYPVLFMLAVCLMVIGAFWLSVSGKSPLIVVLALFAALLMPLLARMSLDLALTVAVWLPINLGLAIASARIAFAVFPARTARSARTVRTPAGEAAFDPGRRLLRMALVTLPFVLVFFLAESSAVLTLLFVAILTQQLAASTEAGPQVAREMLTSNLVGGFAAIVAYELIVMAPFFPFMALVTLLACLAIATWFISERHDAALAGSAMSTMLILLGGAMAPFADNAEVAMVGRLVNVSAALAWVLLAFVALDSLLPERPPRAPNLRNTWRPGPARDATVPAPRG